MQVCNHPDLFEGRPIISAFDMWGLELRLPSAATRVRTNSMLLSPRESLYSAAQRRCLVSNPPSYAGQVSEQPLMQPLDPGARGCQKSTCKT